MLVLTRAALFQTVFMMVDRAAGGAHHRQHPSEPEATKGAASGVAARHACLQMGFWLGALACQPNGLCASCVLALACTLYS